MKVTYTNNLNPRAAWFVLKLSFPANNQTCLKDAKKTTKSGSSIMPDMEKSSTRRRSITMFIKTKTNTMILSWSILISSKLAKQHENREEKMSLTITQT